MSQASADACAFEFDEVQNHGFEGTATLDDCNRVEGIALVTAEISILVACGTSGPSPACAGAITAAVGFQANYDRKTTQCIFSFKQSVNAFDKCIAENTPPEDDSGDDGSGNTGSGSGGGGGGPGGGSGNTGGGESSGPVRRGSFGDSERCYRELPDGNGGITEVTVDCP